MRAVNGVEHDDLRDVHGAEKSRLGLHAGDDIERLAVLVDLKADITEYFCGVRESERAAKVLRKIRAFGVFYSVLKLNVVGVVVDSVDHDIAGNARVAVADPLEKAVIFKRGNLFRLAVIVYLCVAFADDEL